MDEKIGHAHVERTVGLFLRTSSGVKRDEDFFGLVLWLANTTATSGIALMVGAAETITTPATKGKEVRATICMHAPSCW